MFPGLEHLYYYLTLHNALIFHPQRTIQYIGIKFFIMKCSFTSAFKILKNWRSNKLSRKRLSRIKNFLLFFVTLQKRLNIDKEDKGRKYEEKKKKTFLLKWKVFELSNFYSLHFKKRATILQERSLRWVSQVLAWVFFNLIKRRVVLYSTFMSI